MAERYQMRGRRVTLEKLESGMSAVGGKRTLTCGTEEGCMSRFSLLVMLCLLSACGASPSPASNELQAKLVPRVAAWLKSGKPKLNLAEVYPAGSYDSVCIVPEYECLDGQKNLGAVDEYYSTFGACVPENHSALVLVKDHKAHSALIDSRRLRFDTPSSGKCVTALSAFLRTASEGDERVQPPIASLEEQSVPR